MSAQRGGDATIPINTATSNAVDLWGAQLVGIDIPAAWTAADLKFQVARSATETEAFNTSNGGGDYRDLYYNGALVTIPVPAAGVQIAFDNNLVNIFKGVRHVKFVSWDVGAGAVVNQGAARTLVPIVCT